MKQPVISRPQFAAAFLLFLMLFQGAAWLLTWQAMHWRAKVSAFQALYSTETPIEYLTLSRTDFEAARMGRREILIEGKLFDIRRQTLLSGDSIRLDVYHDEVEQALLSMLAPHLKQLDQSHHAAAPLLHWTAQWLAIMFLLPQTPGLQLQALIPDTRQHHWLPPHSLPSLNAPERPPAPVVNQLSF